MKRYSCLAGVCFILTWVLFFTVSAFAQNQQGQGNQFSSAVPQELRRKAVVDEEWEKVADTNKDGIVDNVEIKQWKNRNNNSSSGQESTVGQAETTLGSSVGDSVAERSQVNRPWERSADVNKDGLVDKTEFNQWNQQGNNSPGIVGGPGSSAGVGQQMQGQGNVQERSQVNRPWEKSADNNRDGLVDKTEFGQWNQQGNNPPGKVGGPGSSSQFNQQGPGGQQGSGGSGSQGNRAPGPGGNRGNPGGGRTGNRR